MKYLMTATLICAGMSAMAEDLNGFYLQGGISSNRGDFELQFSSSAGSAGANILSTTGEQLEICGGYIRPIFNSNWYWGPELCGRYGDVSGSRTVSAITNQGDTISAQVSLHSDYAISTRLQVGYVFPRNGWSVAAFAGYSAIDLDLSATGSFNEKNSRISESGYVIGEVFGLEAQKFLSEHSSVIFRISNEKYSGTKTGNFEGYFADAHASYDVDMISIMYHWQF